MKRHVFVQYYKIICVSIIIAVFCAVANVVQMYLIKSTGSKKTIAFFDNISNVTVVIDAGHGGEDGGAVGVTGVLEKDVNLEISKYLKAYFDISGVDCVLTRDRDVLLYKDNQSNKKKYYDLRNRFDYCCSIENPLFISIHQNKFPIEKYFGLQVYYSKNNPASKEVAQLIQDNCVQLIQKDNNRKIKEAGSGIFLLENLKCPAILVECGFLSNVKEEKLLTDSEYQKRIAFCIYKSVIDYLQKNS